MTLSFHPRGLASIAFVAVSLGVSAAFALQGAAAPRGEESARYPHVPNELLVQFKQGVAATMAAATLAKFEAVERETVVSAANRDDMKGDLKLITVPAGRSLELLIRELEKDPNIEFAEHNWIVKHAATSNDTYYTNGSLWGMYGATGSPTNQFGSRANAAWAAGNTGSSTVYVGIIDEGVMINHADLKDNIWKNALEVVDGVDNDGNGYVDDINGWDFVSNNNSVYDGTFDDHGTHVAGTIGGRGGNGTGVAGVCWNIKMIPAKFLGSSGGSIANAIKACDYITNLKNRQGLNVVATNNSWSGGGYSQGMFDAINRANTSNILFVAAAGNGGSDGIGDNNNSIPTYPANYTNANVIAVASITSSGAKSSFSNYGSSTVDLGAPGSSILSTLPYSGSNAKYGYMSGTSMATPHVTGAAALYLASHPGSNASTIKNAILSSTIATSSLSGICVTGGRLNAAGF